jgi:hypothetical protein
MASSLSQSVTLQRLTTKALQVNPSTSANEIGVQLAGTVYRGLIG